MQTKKCSRCNRFLSVKKFYASRKWYSAQCTECTAISRKEKYVKRVRAGARPDPHCACGETQPDKFYKNCSTHSGYQNQCKRCAANAKGRRWTERREEELALREERRNKIRAKFKTWCETGEWK